MCYHFTMNKEVYFGRRRSPQFGVATPDYSGDAKSEDDVIPTPGDTLRPAATSLLPDLSGYTHTVPEASRLMQEAGCKYHSERKVQRLCAGGKVDCYRLQTTRSGQPVTEWLVNGTALLEHVRTYEQMRDDSQDVATPQAAPSVSGVAGALASDPRTRSTERNNEIVARGIMATPNYTGVATDEAEFAEKPASKADLTAPPSHVGDAIGEGEIRQTPEVLILIEKAELRAQYEAQSELIVELREDKKYLREAVAAHQSNEIMLQRDLKELAIKASNNSALFLETMQNITLKGVLTKPEKAPEGGDNDQPPYPTIGV